MEEEEKEVRNQREICLHLTRGYCNHGLSGKKSYGGRKECKFFHPRSCARLLRGGLKTSAGGCKDGRACKEFHPKMCRRSLNGYECAENCRAGYHLGRNRNQITHRGGGRGGEGREGKGGEARRERGREVRGNEARRDEARRGGRREMRGSEARGGGRSVREEAGTMRRGGANRTGSARGGGDLEWSKNAWVRPPPPPPPQPSPPPALPPLF